MPVDPNIILQAGRVKPVDYGEVASAALNQIGQRQQIAYQRDQMAANRRAQAAAERQQATLGEVGQLAAGGDITGARRAALGSGNFDIVKKLDEMDDGQVSRMKAIAESTAPIIATLGQIQAGAERTAAFQQAAPMLAQAGYQPAQIEQLAGQINNDGFIGLTIANGQKIGDYQRQMNADRTFEAGRADQAQQVSNADRTFNAGRADQAYRVRNDAENRGVTVRGQNMTDDRARAAIGAVAGAGGARAPKMTEAQAKDGFNAKRMVGANDILDGFENTPGFRPGGAEIGALFSGGKMRQYEAAKDEWADSLLRLTTGQAAPAHEVAKSKAAYFPNWRDNGETIALKSLMRARVTRDALQRGGPGALPSTPAAPRPATKPAAKPRAPSGNVPSDIEAILAKHGPRK
jgi:hypothetical protein